MIQGTAAQITLTALSTLHNYFKAHYKGYARILFTVHDSITFEIHKSCFHEVMNVIKEVMERQPLESDIKFTIDAEVGTSYGNLAGIKQTESGLWIAAKEKYIEKFDKLQIPK
jgi:DNA polymerase I-like protein with 3'-5' exonuclease and polymerase domains